SVKKSAETSHSPPARFNWRRYQPPGASPRCRALLKESTSESPTRNRNREGMRGSRSEEHTSELQSRENLVCRLLLEKKNFNLLARTKRSFTKKALEALKITIIW